MTCHRYFIPTSMLLAACGGAIAPAAHPKKSAQFDICELSRDAQFRQRVIAEHNGSSWSFEAVVEKSGCKLVVLFLTPASTRSLLVTQTGRTISSKYYGDQSLPFPEENILRDIVRIFFAERSASAAPDGTQVIQGKHELYRDTYRNGSIKTREVLTGSGRTPSLLVTYEPGSGTNLEPGKVIARNQQFDYTLRIETQFVP